MIIKYEVQLVKKRNSYFFTKLPLNFLIISMLPEINRLLTFVPEAVVYS